MTDKDILHLAQLVQEMHKNKNHDYVLFVGVYNPANKSLARKHDVVAARTKIIKLLNKLGVFQYEVSHLDETHCNILLRRVYIYVKFDMLNSDARKVMGAVKMEYNKILQDKTCFRRNLFQR